MSKLPSFQFYPGDWMKDPGLRICSAGARGVWIDVLCLMFESPRRGFLVTNGKPWTLEQTAVALTGNAEQNISYLKELVRNGVMKQSGNDRKCPWKNGAFFNARMVSDERSREAWRSQKRRQVVEKKRSDSAPLSSQFPAVLHSSSSSSNLTTKTPLPPAVAGDPSDGELLKDQKNYSYFNWNGGHVVVRTGTHRRIFTKNEWSAYSGLRIEDIVERVKARGFWAKIYEPAASIEAAKKESEASA